MRAFLCSLLLAAVLQGAPADPQLPPVERLQTDALAYVEAQAAAMAGSYTFRVLRPPTLPRVPEGGQLTFTPSHLSRRELGGPFFACFKMFLDGRPLGLVRIDLEGKWTGRLWRARSAVARKVVPSAEAFEAVDFEGIPPAGAVTELPPGMRLRVPIGPGHFLALQDLEGIPVVNAGEPVRMELVSGGLTIAVEALARSSGALGDRVRLEMPTSHKNIQAVVVGPGEARVQWPGAN